MRLPRPASLQGPSSTLRPSGPVLPRSRSFYGRAFPAFSLLRLPPPLPLTLPPVVSCPFRHRGKPGALSACGVRVLSAPAPLSVGVFPVLLLAELASLPDPTGSPLCAPPCCARSAPIHRRAVLPALVPAVALTVSRCRPALSPFFSCVLRR